MVTQVIDWLMPVIVRPVYSDYAGFAGLPSLMLAMLITLTTLVWADYAGLRWSKLLPLA